MRSPIPAATALAVAVTAAILAGPSALANDEGDDPKKAAPADEAKPDDETKPDGDDEAEPPASPVTERYCGQVEVRTRRISEKRVKMMKILAYRRPDGRRFSVRLLGTDAVAGKKIREYANKNVYVVGQRIGAVVHVARIERLVNPLSGKVRTVRGVLVHEERGGVKSVRPDPSPFRLTVEPEPEPEPPAEGEGDGEGDGEPGGEPGETVEPREPEVLALRETKGLTQGTLIALAGKRIEAHVVYFEGAEVMPKEGDEGAHPVGPDGKPRPFIVDEGWKVLEVRAID